MSETEKINKEIEKYMTIYENNRTSTTLTPIQKYISRSQCSAIVAGLRRKKIKLEEKDKNATSSTIQQILYTIHHTKDNLIALHSINISYFKKIGLFYHT